MILLGIDPGLHGAWGAIHDEHATYRVFPLIDGKVDYVQVHRELEEMTKGDFVKAVIEKVSAMPGQGVTSMFTFGKGAGTLIGLLIALRIPYLEVAPQTWKAKILRDTDKSKGAAIMHVKTQWPNLVLPTTKAGQEGVCDALCMASYARSIYG